MEPQYLNKLKTLRKVTCLPGSWDNDFIKSFKDDSDLTPDQCKWIDNLYYKYRVQIGHHDPMPDSYPQTKHEIKEKENIKVKWDAWAKGKPRKG